MKEDIKKGDILFVYGTLRRGERADLERAQGAMNVQFIGEDRIGGNIYNLGSYPGLKGGADWADFGHPVVAGDTFRVLDASIGVILDHYEGFPYLYNRTQVQTEKGRTAWVYTYNDDISSDKLIPSGDWTKRHVVSASKEAA